MNEQFFAIRSKEMPSFVQFSPHFLNKLLHKTYWTKVRASEKLLNLCFLGHPVLHLIELIGSIIILLSGSFKGCQVKQCK